MDGKKISLFVYFLMSAINFGQSDYYQGTEGLVGNALKAKLHSIIKGHIRYPYTSTGIDVWQILEDTDEDPANPDNVILLYSGRSQEKAYRDQAI